MRKVVVTGLGIVSCIGNNKVGGRRLIVGKEVMITVHEESWMSNNGRKKAIVATLTKILL